MFYNYLFANKKRKIGLIFVILLLLSIFAYFKILAKPYFIITNDVLITNSEIKRYNSYNTFPAIDFYRNIPAKDIGVAIKETYSLDKNHLLRDIPSQSKDIMFQPRPDDLINLKYLSNQLTLNYDIPNLSGNSLKIKENSGQRKVLELKDNQRILWQDQLISINNSFYDTLSNLKNGALNIIEVGTPETDSTLEFVDENYVNSFADCTKNRPNSPYYKLNIIPNNNITIESTYHKFCLQKAIPAFTEEKILSINYETDTELGGELVIYSGNTLYTLISLKGINKTEVKIPVFKEPAYLYIYTNPDNDGNISRIEINDLNIASYSLIDKSQLENVLNEIPEGIPIDIDTTSLPEQIRYTSSTVEIGNELLFNPTNWGYLADDCSKSLPGDPDFSLQYEGYDNATLMTKSHTACISKTFNLQLKPETNYHLSLNYIPKGTPSYPTNFKIFIQANYFDGTNNIFIDEWTSLVSGVKDIAISKLKNTTKNIQIYLYSVPNPSKDSINISQYNNLQIYEDGPSLETFLLTSTFEPSTKNTYGLIASTLENKYKVVNNSKNMLIALSKDNIFYRTILSLDSDTQITQITTDNIAPLYLVSCSKCEALSIYITIEESSLGQNIVYVICLILLLVGVISYYIYIKNVQRRLSKRIKNQY